MVLRVSSTKSHPHKTYFLAMQIALSSYAQVLRYPSLRYLPPPQCKGIEWNFIFEAHSIEILLVTMDNPLTLLLTVFAGTTFCQRNSHYFTACSTRGNVVSKFYYKFITYIIYCTTTSSHVPALYLVDFVSFVTATYRIQTPEHTGCMTKVIRNIAT